MTEDRKQELRQLLARAMGSLLIQYRSGGPSIPVDVYREYLKESWKYYGVDCLSFAFSVRLELYTVTETIRSNLFNFIKEELAPFIDGDFIPIGNYRIENDSLRSIRYSRMFLPFLIERLLQIALVRGIDDAVSVFDRYSHSQGMQGFFQNVLLLDGIKMETEVKVFEGVRLVPLSSSELPWEIIRYLPGFPHSVFIDLVRDFVGKTLLVIDHPGLSIFHEPAPNPSYPRGFPVDDLPFPVEKHDVQFPNMVADYSFQDLFCQALSLACNTPVQIVNEGWFLAADKSFSPHSDTLRMRSFSRFAVGGSVETGEGNIEEAKNLYHIMCKRQDIGQKLTIPIDRWMRSKAGGGHVDKIIDLGIAFEALYLSDVNEELTFRLGVRAAWYLGKDKTEREKLLKKFGDIYRGRSNAVHSGKLDEPVRFGEERISIRKFIERVQDLCRDSILKILNSEEFPDHNYWDSLIVAGEDEQASS